MPEIHLEPPVEYQVRISPAKAMALTLPLLELAPRFPGLDPWFARLASRLGPEARADYRLMALPLSGGLYYLLVAEDEEEGCEAALKAMAEATPEEIRGWVVRGLAGRLRLEDPDSLLRLLEKKPAELERLLGRMQGPAADESFPVDRARVIALLRRPVELKALLVNRLGQLWHDHIRPRWQVLQPTLQWAAAAARQHLGKGDPEAVFRAVTGRNLSDHYRPMVSAARRFIFHPVPFLGPYVAVADIDLEGKVPVLLVGFGGALLNPAATDRPRVEALLPVLTALADEARLEAITFLHERGQVCAADMMSRFGWSQPTASRHLRALESTGLVGVQRIEGVKWYRIDPARAHEIARALQQFLSGRDTEWPG